jgi:hypothetical protein
MGVLSYVIEFRAPRRRVLNPRRSDPHLKNSYGEPQMGTDLRRYGTPYVLISAEEQKSAGYKEMEVAISRKDC